MIVGVGLGAKVGTSVDGTGGCEAVGVNTDCVGGCTVIVGRIAAVGLGSEVAVSVGAGGLTGVIAGAAWLQAVQPDKAKVTINTNKILFILPTLLHKDQPHRASHLPGS